MDRLEAGRLEDIRRPDRLEPEADAEELPYPELVTDQTPHQVGELGQGTKKSVKAGKAEDPPAFPEK